MDAPSPTDKETCLRMMNSINSAHPEEGLRDIARWMAAALRVFIGEEPVGPGSTTIAVVSDLISLAMAVLHKEPSQDKLRRLLDPKDPGFLQILIEYIMAAIDRAPGIAGRDAQISAVSGLRVLILRSLAKIIALSSFDHLPQDGRTLNNCGDMVVSTFIATNMHTVLVQIAGGASHVSEDIKIASSECLFVFTLRNNRGRVSIAENQETMLKLLDVIVKEPSPMVRNYIAACIRELSNTHPHQVEQAGLPALAAKIISDDSSADVRVLIIESLEVLYKMNADTKVHPTLAEVLVNLLIKEETNEVSDAACRIIDTLAYVESQKVAAALAIAPQLPLAQQPCKFTVRFIDCRGAEALVNTILTQTSLRAVALAARALRRLVQYAPWKVGVGRRILNSSLSEILALIKDGESCASSNDLVAVSLVELAIGVALMLAQSAETRAFVQHKLHEHAQWMEAVRTSLLNLLDKAAPEYFTDLEIFDSTSGAKLNVLDGVEWDESGWPTTESVKRSLNGARGVGGMPLSLQYSMPDVQELKVCRFTQVLLRFSVHLALGNEPLPERSQSAPSSVSLSPEQRPQPTSRQRSASMPPPPQWGEQPSSTGPSVQPRQPPLQTPIPPSTTQYQQYQPSAQYPSYNHRAEAHPRRKVVLGFTNPRSRSASRSRSRSPRVPEAISPSRFIAHDAALKLTIKYSRHFTSVVRAKHQAALPRWEAVCTSTNPWKPPTKKQSGLRKQWTVEDLKAGDLFIFSIPYDRLSVAAIESVLHATKKHQDTLKKSFLITPQKDKGRRWCLFDLLNMVMPHVQDLLIKLARLVIAIGEKETQVPLFMLREREIQGGEGSVHPGNLCEIVDQLTYYCTVHQRQADDVADIVSKMQALAREDPEACNNISTSSSSS